MKKIYLKSSRGSYPICVGAGALKHLEGFVKQLYRGQKMGKVLVISQQPIAKHYLKQVERLLKKTGVQVITHLVSNGEKAKSQKVLFDVYRVLLKYGFERRDFVLALGGGVVGDLSGYAASSYLRGIRFANCATTLLAQVDSAIGGKTGINLEEGKNLVGAFYQPQFVLSDERFLKTLPNREYKASLAEVVKYGVIRDERFFRYLENNVAGILNRKSSVVEHMVATCSKIKAMVVMHDEKETKGERMILNYGHTFGHAFEQALQYKGMYHGEAVAVGMVCAARMAVKLKLITEVQEDRQLKLLKALGLPTSVAKFKLKSKNVLHAMMSDKKKQAGKIRFIVPDRLGHVRVVENASPRYVREAIECVGVKK